METHLKVIGVILILLALAHTIFPSYFRWKIELSSLSNINRQMMYVHAFFIAVTVLLMGLLCLTSAAELLATDLGKRVSLGLGIFWMMRLLTQFFGYTSIVWKGKSFETGVHILLTLLWTYLSFIFLSIYLG